MNIPKIIFIIPYRDREQHKHFFVNYMKYIMEDYNQSDYETFFINQNDKVIFNRGALKNIGFLYVKEKYPDDYKNITLVFNDVDTVPYKKNLLNYETTKGTVKHFYGHKTSLGGIFSINAEDFENINGFPCYWGWGFEDNSIFNRCKKHKLNIDRNNFYAVQSHDILHFFDTNIKTINILAVDILKYDRGYDGINTIRNLNYNINNINNNIIDVNHFEPYLILKKQRFTYYNIYNGSIISSRKLKTSKRIIKY